MLDIGFSELLVIGGVALVVLGPEKLAVVARSAGKWSSKAQRYVNDVKADIAREGELAELRKLKQEMESTGRDLGQSLRTTADDVQRDLKAIESSAQHEIKALGDAIDPTAGSTGGSTANPVANPVANPTAPQLNDSEVQASIQASLDIPVAQDGATNSLLNPAYQNSLDATLMPPPLDDPIAMRMEIETIQDELARLEQRFLELKQSLTHTASSDAVSRLAA